MAYPRVSSLKTPDDLRRRLRKLDIHLPVDDVVDSGPSAVLGSDLHYSCGVIGNRFCILPMEGWDGQHDGRPTDLVRRRWTNFGLSGAKLIWGGEAVAVRHDGRANPNQLLINDRNLSDIESLRKLLESTHEQHFGTTTDLVVGLQLTHSGRFSRPNDKHRSESRVVYRHPCLDERFGVNNDSALLSDDELARLIDDFVYAAELACKAGFSFVDIKHCHGYLGHELLSGFDRPGRFGGSLENRTRFLREIVSGIRSQAAGLEIGVRLSVFDFRPFEPGPDGTGTPSTGGSYTCAFGGDGTGIGIDLREPIRFLELLESLGVQLVCSTAGSPYYNPHVQRPAYFPPSDGYQPPEDPLVGVARQINMTAELKRRFPNLIVVGSGYSYLQEWLPNISQAVVRAGMADLVGLGRISLSYPDLPADVLAGRPPVRGKLCRTFSECTTAPRSGMVSGCYPLDPFYKARPERKRLLELKSSRRL